MPADFYIDAERHIVFSKATGVLGRSEALDHMDRLERNPDFRSDFNQLFDFRSVTAVQLSHEEIKVLATRTIFHPSSRRAFVVARDFDFGIGRVFGTYRDLAGEPGVAVFREMKEALSWLSLPSELEPWAKK
jgi:hypothetical protein